MVLLLLWKLVNRSGTCAMKPKENGGVDKYLNVYGTQNLKVTGPIFEVCCCWFKICMSICPSNPGGSTYSTALVISEKAAMIVGKELGLTM
jgi:alcohol oxidase